MFIITEVGTKNGSINISTEVDTKNGSMFISTEVGTKTAACLLAQRWAPKKQLVYKHKGGHQKQQNVNKQRWAPKTT